MTNNAWINECELYAFLISIGIDADSIFVIEEGDGDISFAIPDVTPIQMALLEQFAMTGNA